MKEKKGGNISFKDINYKDHYDSIKDNLINDFYIPTLKNAKIYKRTVAYFESKSLSLVAEGLKDFILNHGKMELVCGPKLTPEEVKSIQLGIKNPEDIITSNFLNDLDNLEDEIAKNHVKILGWMIANNLLKIKIAIKKDKNGQLSNTAGILHYKIGILEDNESNIISFSGSINDTNNAWSEKNLEEFHVFRSWIPGEQSHLMYNIGTFRDVYYGNDDSFEVISVPEAVEKRLISISPSNFEDLKFELKQEENLEKEKIDLYDYQNEAILKWYDNNCKGIFEMATGTGKTYTSLGCLEKVLDENEKLLCVISVPYQHLIPQWMNSVVNFGLEEKFNKIIIADGTNHKWKYQMEKFLLRLSLSEKFKYFLILTTHDTYCKDEFIKYLKDNKCSNYLLIGDEMHELGSLKHRKGLIEEYDFRLGLSATPIRFSEYETEFIINYFNNIVFKFTLKDALNKYNRNGETFLTPFYYKPYFLSLNKNELFEYQDITRKLFKVDEKDPMYESKKNNLFFIRSNIIKNANQKFIILKEILKSLDDYSGLIIYCSYSQIDKVCELLSSFDIIYKKFTMNLNSRPDDKYNGLSERQMTLNDFEDGTVDVLVAMHCLDEGVDIPSAKQAIFMCSSNSSREFIQRIGRVIRRYPNKKRSYIYDMIVKPQLSKKEFKELYKYEKKIFEIEKERYRMIGNISMNYSEVDKKLSKNM